MDIGAILFILAVFYFGIIDNSWRDKPINSHEDSNKIDVLHGGDL